MSFTAQVKDELSRIEPTCSTCNYAQLSAMVRVCGTLSFRGSGRYAIKIATETGAVARSLIKLTHELFDLETQLTVRRSNLHKTRNYLIEIPEQDELEQDLMNLGILLRGRGLAQGIAPFLVQKPCCAKAYLRGAFMAGGFIADPRGDFHLEIALTSDPLAQDMLLLLHSFSISARINRRRSHFAIYLKKFEDIAHFLQLVGASKSVRALDTMRRFKSIRSQENRHVNAEMANIARSTTAAAEQMALIKEVHLKVPVKKLSPALKEFMRLREAYPDASLTELGALCSPPASKSAMYHRLLRLQELLRDVDSKR